VGKHVVIGRGPEPAEVIGVSEDVKNQGLAQDTRAQVYIPFPQLPWGNMDLLVRTTVPSQSIVSAVRAQISAVDSDQPVTSIQTVDELIDSSRAQPRFTMLLLGTFSVTALALAAIGIYSVLAYSVTERWRELGIRLALGAERADILRLIVRQGLTLATIGIVIGLIAALLLTRLMSSVLYKVGALDPMAFALTPLVLLFVALLASYLPARRATKVDPATVLRET
jgi:putative ABC transport system permease protein